jgi:hypothetical protein
MTTATNLTIGVVALLRHSLRISALRFRSSSDFEEGPWKGLIPGKCMTDLLSVITKLSSDMKEMSSRLDDLEKVVRGCIQREKKVPESPLSA